MADDSPTSSPDSANYQPVEIEAMTVPVASTILFPHSRRTPLSGFLGGGNLWPVRGLPKDGARY